MSSTYDQQTTATTAPDTTGHTAGENPGRVYSVIGIVLAVIGLFLLPIVIGPAGAVLGYIGHRKGDSLGMKVVIGAIIATVIGMALGYVVFSAATG